mmetsp:Transcript_37719/g.101377  ORF Transcript_37719/g.101377 Transcript_37719/m.101377 type:complete len:138 (+) Transcript_37719:3-416(+)
MADVARSGRSAYLFAISCFNISHMLAMFFDLVTAVSVSPVRGAHVAGRRQLKFLAGLVLSECSANGTAQVSDAICRRVMDELFFEVVCYVHGRWLEMSRSQEGLTIMDYQRALEQGFAAHDAFWRAPCLTLSELRLA